MCVVCLHILISFSNNHLDRDVKLNFFPACVCPSHLRRKRRRRCRQVLEFLSLWATLLTRRPSTRKTWGKRWSSWCWTRRTAPPLLTVSSLRVSIDSSAKCCLSCALITRAWIVFSPYIQMSQQTGRRSCSRSFRSTRWWRSQTTKTTNGIKRSRRCCKLTKAKQLQCVSCTVIWPRMDDKWPVMQRWMNFHITCSTQLWLLSCKHSLVRDDGVGPVAGVRHLWWKQRLCSGVLVKCYFIVPS